MPALTEKNDLVRARNVAASECYALMGYHPYTTKQKIYDRLMSPIIEQRVDQTEAMALGVYFEPHIAKYAARKLGLRLRSANRTIEHSKVSLCATPDYYIQGQRMLMEIKLSGIMYGWTEDDLHPHYEYQARAQLACTDRDVCIVVALVGVRLYIVPVVRDMEKERVLLETVQAFWDQHIMAGVRPTQEEETSVRVVTVTGK